VIVVHEYVKEDLRKQISQIVENLVPKLEKNLALQPINKPLIDTLLAKKAIFDELDKVDSLAADLRKKEFAEGINFADLLVLRAVLADMWIDHIIAVRFDCLDEDVLHELIHTADRILAVNNL